MRVNGVCLANDVVARLQPFLGALGKAFRLYSMRSSRSARNSTSKNAHAMTASGKTRVEHVVLLMILFCCCL